MQELESVDAAEDVMEMFEVSPPQLPTGEVLQLTYSHQLPSGQTQGTVNLDWVCNMCKATNFARSAACQSTELVWGIFLKLQRGTIRATNSLGGLLCIVLLHSYPQSRSSVGLFLSGSPSTIKAKTEFQCLHVCYLPLQGSCPYSSACYCYLTLDSCPQEAGMPSM